jgi:hypothetical protein
MRIEKFAAVILMGALVVGTTALMGCQSDTVGTSSGIGGPVGQPGANGLDNGPGTNGYGTGTAGSNTSSGAPGTGSAGR